MKEQFVNYNQALALKELGFDEPCFGIFYGTDDLKLFNDCRWEERTNSKFLIFFEDREEFCTAITWQQAFDWFREKQNLHSDISTFVWDYGKKELGFSVRTYFNPIKEDTEKLIHPEVYQTYEEAQVACLNKLIEIVEQQNK